MTTHFEERRINGVRLHHKNAAHNGLKTTTGGRISYWLTPNHRTVFWFTHEQILHVEAQSSIANKQRNVGMMIQKVLSRSIRSSLQFSGLVKVLAIKSSQTSSDSVTDQYRNFKFCYFSDNTCCTSHSLVPANRVSWLTADITKIF